VPVTKHKCAVSKVPAPIVIQLKASEVLFLQEFQANSNHHSSTIYQHTVLWFLHYKYR